MWQVREACMIDREKVLTVLGKRFPGSTPEQMAAAANAVMGLEDEWEDVTTRGADAGDFALHCGEKCYVADQVQRGAEVRILVRWPREA
jgi:hypothetical protein